jgi:hypothetical protein
MAMGDRKRQKIIIICKFQTRHSSSIVVEHPPHHLKIEGLSLATADGTGREKKAKIIIISEYWSSNSPYHPRVD